MWMFAFGVYIQKYLDLYSRQLNYHWMLLKTLWISISNVTVKCGYYKRILFFNVTSIRVGVAYQIIEFLEIYL